MNVVDWVRFREVNTDTQVIGTLPVSRERRSQILSVIIHLLLLFILALPWMNFPVPPPGQQGIIVQFGEPETGGEEGGDPDSDTDEISPPSDVTPLPESTPDISEQPVKATPPSETSREKPRMTQKESDVAASKEMDRAKSDAAKVAEERRQKEAEKQARIEAEAEARRKADEEARKKQEYEKAKSRYGDLFGNPGSPSGDKPGEAGDPSGKPSGDRLSGLSTGAGRVGDGLGDRGVLHYPRIEDRSQQTGVVVIYICVDTKGNVESARFTQKGSTTTDKHLVDLALKTARQYRFTSSSIQSQCGTITFEFKVK